MNPPILSRSCFALLIWLTLTLPAFAQSTVLWNTGTGDYLTPSNWSTNTVPVAGDSVFISDGVAFLSGTSSVQEITLGDTGSGGLGVVSGGNLTTSFGLYIGVNADSAMVVSGVGTNVNIGDIDGNGLVVGWGSSGDLTIDLGARVQATTVGIEIGRAAGAIGSLNLSGRAGARGILEAVNLYENNGDATVTFDGGILRAAANTSLLSLFEAGDVQIDDGGAFIDTNGRNVIISTVLSGTGGLTKQGTGTLTLTQNNTYAGGTTIEAGTILISSNNALGTGPVTLDGGTLETTAGISTNRSISLSSDGGTFDMTGTSTLSGDITGRGSLTKEGTGTLILTENNSYSGGTTISDGTLQIGNGGTSGRIVGNITNNSTLQVNRSDDLTLDGDITGTGNLVKSGAGTLILTGDTSFSATTLESGVLQIGDGGRSGTISGNISDTSGVGTVTFDRSDRASYSDSITGGTLQKSGTGTLVLTGSISPDFITVSEGTLQLGNGGTGGGGGDPLIQNDATLVFNRSADFTSFTGIGGGGTVQQDGSNRITVAGVWSNTTTNVNSGEVNVDGFLGNTTVNVTAGGTLSGSGIITGDVNVQDHGHLAANQTDGLQVGSFSTESLSNLNITLQAPGTNSALLVDNGLVLQGLLNVANGGGFANGTYRLIDYFGTLSGDGLTIGSIPTGFNPAGFTISTATSGQVNLVVSTVATEQFWDGANTSPSMVPGGAGGSGEWDLSSTNWTNAAGNVNSAWTSGNDAVFGGSAGTVTFRDSITVDAILLRTDGYLFTTSAPTGQIAFNALRGGLSLTFGGQLTVDANAPDAVVDGQLTLQNSVVLFVNAAGAIHGGSFTLSGDTTVFQAASTDGIYAGDFTFSPIEGDVGGRLTLNGGSARVTSLASTGGAGSIVNGLGAVTLTVDQAADTTFDGRIRDGGPGSTLALVKAGPGTLNLTGIGTITGGLTIDGGTLQISDDGDLNLGTTFDTQVAANGAGNLLINGGGKLTTGNALIGVNYAGKATVSGATSSWTADQVISGYFGTGELEILNGGTLVSDTGLVGPSDVGAALVSGSGSTWQSGFVSVGSEDGGDGLLTVEKGGDLQTHQVAMGAVNGTAMLSLTGSTTDGRGTIETTSLIYQGGTTSIEFHGGILKYTGTNINGFDLIDGFAEGDITLSGEGLFVDTNGLNPVISSSLVGLGGLTKQGTGTLTITSNNFYSGPTNHTQGTLLVSGETPFGGTDGSELTLDGGTSFGIADDAGIFLENPVSVAGNIAILAGNTGGGFLELDGPVDLGSSVRTITLGQNDTELCIMGVISGAGGLNFQAGTGTTNHLVEMCGLDSNAYSGLTTIGADVTLELEKFTDVNPDSLAILGDVLVQTDGMLVNFGHEQILDDSDITLQSGAIWQISGLSDGEGETVGGLSGSGDVYPYLFNSYLGVDHGSFSGVLQDSVDFGTTLEFQKVGVGTLTLSGASTYTGDTLVVGGTLLVNGSLGNTEVTVAFDATLGGDGAIAGPVDILNGGTIAPGTSPGTLTTGPLILRNSSLLRYELDTPGMVGGGVNDLTIVNGNLTLNGRLHIADQGSFGSGTYRLLNYSGSLTDNGLLFGVIPGGFEVAVSTATANQVNLSVTETGLQYWDGFNTTSNNVVNGGNGIWHDGDGISNWTTSTGNANSTWADLTAVFSGTAGTVVIDNGDSVRYAGMQFLTDDYEITGSADEELLPIGVAQIDIGSGLLAEISATIGGTGGVRKTGSGTLILSGDNTFTGNINLNAGTLLVDGLFPLDETGTLNLAGGTTFGVVFGGDSTIGNPITILGNITLSAPFGFLESQGDVSLGSTLRTITLFEDTDVCLGGTISGTGGLTFVAETPSFEPVVEMCGPGNTYSGLTTVGNGVALYIHKDDGAVAINDDLQINDGALVVIDDIGSSTMQIAPTVDLTVNGNGELLFGGFDSNFAQTFRSINGDGFITNGDPGAGTFDLTLSVGSGNFSGVIGEDSGAGSIILRKTGSGTLTLSGTNTYTGGTEAVGGTLRLENNRALGTSPVTGLGGRLDLADTLKISNALALQANTTVNVSTGSARYDGVISQTGNTFALTKSGAGTLVLTGNNTSTGRTIINAGVLRIGAGGTTGSVSGNIVNNTSLIFNRSNASTYAGVISGPGAVTKSGAGRLIFTGANTFTGLTTVSSGELRLQRTGTPSLAGNLTVASGASVTNSSANRLSATSTLNLNGAFLLQGTDQRAGTLKGSGIISNTFTAPANSTMTIGAGNFAGSLVNGGSAGAVLKMLKNTGGTLILTGNSTYTGTTTVAAGLLKVNGSLGNTNVLVQSGATLGGTGTIAGNVTVQNGGMFKPGNSPGTITVGSLNLNPASMLEFELSTPGIVGGGVNDLTNVTGDLILDGNIDIVQLPGFGDGEYTLFTYGGTLTDNGINFGIAPGGFDFTVDSSESGQIKVAVEETTSQFWDGLNTSPNGVINGGDGIWDNSTTNWTNSGGNANSSWVGGSAVFAGLSGGTVTLGDNVRADELLFRADNYLISSGETNNELTLTGAAQIDVDAGVLATVESGVNGNRGLNKTGPGTLWLRGQNTYSGATNLLEGTLLIGSDNALSSGALNIEDGSTFGIFPGESRFVANKINLNGNAFYIGGAGGSLELEGTVDLGSATRRITFTDEDAELCFSGVLTGGRGGGLMLRVNSGVDGDVLTSFCGSDPNTWSGRLTIGRNVFLVASKEPDVVSLSGDVDIRRSGTLVIASDGQFSSGSSANVDGTWLFDREDGTATEAIAGLTGTGTVVAKAGNVGGDYTLRVLSGNFGGTITDRGRAGIRLIKFGSGTLILTGENSYGFGTTIEGGTLQIGDGGTTGSIIRHVVNNGSLLFNRSDAITFNAKVSGTGILAQEGSGKLILTANHTYTGLTVVTDGTLQIGDGGARGNLDGRITDNARLVFNRSDDFRFRNSIGGFGDLVKAGAGRLTLTADSDVGSVKINAGELNVSESLTSITLIVKEAAGLIGNGEVHSRVTVADRGTLSPGVDGRGTLALDSLRLNSDSRLTYDLNSPTGSNDLIRITDNLVLNGSLSINPGRNFSTGTYRLFNYTGDLTNNGLRVDTSIPGLTLRVDVTTPDQVNLIVSRVAAPCWNGASTEPTGAVEGGNGVWNNSSTNWTNQSGTVSSTWGRQSAIFAGSAGTVSVAEDVRFRELAFQTDGYLVESGGGALIMRGNGVIDVDSTVSAEISADIAGSGRLTKAGPGTLLLSGDNTWSGGTTLSEGVLQIGSNTALGTGLLSIAGGTLGGDGGFHSITNNIAVTSDFSLDPNLDVLELFGAVKLGGVTRRITFSGDGQITFGGPVAGTGGMNLQAVDGLSNARLVLSGSEDNTYTGLTTVGPDIRLALLKDTGHTAIAGDVKVQAGGILAALADDQIADSANLQLNGSLELTRILHEKINRLSGSGSILFFAGSAEATGELEVRSGNFHGTITDAIAPLQLTKTGPGTLRLSGDNSYSGPTVIEGGILSAESNSALGTSVVIPDGSGSTVQIVEGVTLTNRFEPINGGVILNQGTIDTGADPSILNFAGGVTIANSGTVRSESLTISGNAGTFQLNNQGSDSLIESLGAEALHLITTDATVVNEGTIRAFGPGILLENGGTIVNEGEIASTAELPSIRALAGSVMLRNHGTLTGDVDLSDSINTVELSGGSTIAGNLDIGTDRKSGLTLDSNAVSRLSEAVSGELTFRGLLLKTGDGTWVVDKSLGSSNTLILSGVLALADGSNRTLNGRVANEATLRIDRSSSMTIAADIVGSGRLILDGTSNTILLGDNSYAGGTRINSVSLTIAGEGTLPGEVRNDGKLHFKRDADYTFDGVIRGSGDVIQESQSDLTFVGEQKYSGTTFVREGGFILEGSVAGDVVVDDGATFGGNGTIGGDLFLAGMISPGNSPGSIHIRGDFTLDSTAELVIEIASRRNYDRLTIDRNARLAGTLRINVLGNYKPTAGTTFAILEADSISGQFERLIASAGWSLDYADTGLRLLFGSSRKPYQFYAEGSNEHSVAGALEQLRTDELGDRTDFDRNVRPVLDASAPEELRLAFNAILPSQAIAFSESVFARSRSWLPQMAARLADLRSRNTPLNYTERGAADMKDVIAPEPDRWGFWMDAAGLFNQTASFDNLGRGDGSSAAGTAGADYRFSDNLTMGFYTGYIGSWNEYDGTSRVDSNGSRFGIYSTWQNGGFYLNNVVGGEWNSYDWKRQIVFPGLNRTATADADGTVFETMFGGGYDWKPCPWGTFGLFGALEYTRLFVDSFTESGAGSLNLKVNDQDADSLRTNFGIQFTGTIPIGERTLRPSIRAAWRHEYLAGDRTVSSALLGGAGPGFSTTLRGNRRKDSLLLNGGFSMDLLENVSGSIYYTGDLGPDGTDNIHSINAGLRWEF